MSKTKPTYLYRHALISIPELEPRIPCEVERLSADQLDRLTAVRSLAPQKYQQFQHRFQRGDTCFVANHKGQAVHFSWFQIEGIHPIQPAGRSRMVASAEAWIFDCRTVESARGQNIYPYVLTKILRSLQSQAFTCAWIYTSRDNVASQRGIAKAGFRITQRLYCLEFAGRVLPLPPMPVR